MGDEDENLKDFVFLNIKEVYLLDKVRENGKDLVHKTLDY